MLSWWSDLTPWLRLVTAAGFIVVGIVLVVFSVRGDGDDSLVQFFARRQFVAGVVIAGVGVVLAFIGGRSEAEKKGYRF